MTKHLFYSLLTTFLLAALAEFFRPGFVVLFFNMNWLFLAVVASGMLILTKGEK